MTPEEFEAVWARLFTQSATELEALKRITRRALCDSDSNTTADPLEALRANLDAVGVALGRDTMSRAEFDRAMHVTCGGTVLDTLRAMVEGER